MTKELYNSLQALSEYCAMVPDYRPFKKQIEQVLLIHPMGTARIIATTLQ